MLLDIVSSGCHNTAEFQYNDKKHMATGRTPFKLNFGRHPWKGDLVVQMEIP